jgi:hypothetical protein
MQNTLRPPPFALRHVLSLSKGIEGRAADNVLFMLRYLSTNGALRKSR